ncbi:hypothetical protein HHI36_012759 [Cryptolaemus montrouzieri]|uniref:Fanconi anemia group I protein n=1 Tax=Cryptolaemus montrouzieri TaxID=559131 RepID=A0ABD2NFF7_9CUCU
MTGKEFKKQLLNTLCMLQWTPERVTAIASMFLDIPLTKDEHLQVINKLTSYIEKLTSQELPGFVFQLLKLCRDHHFKLVVVKLQTYFGMRIYDMSSIISCSSSDTVDLDGIESASHQDLIEAESTVLYHIHSFATMSSNSIKEYLLHLKNLIKTPEFILHPFQLTILLIISTVQYYEEKVFEVLKPCISRCYNELHKKETSLWFRDMIPIFTNIESIFTQVLNASMKDRDTVLQGMVNFAFVLLNIKSGLPLIFIDPIAEKEWNLGILILLKIVRHKRNKGGVIVKELINNVLTDQNVTQYIECLYLLSRNLTLILLENQSCVIEIMEDLIQVPGATAIQLLDAIVPLTKVSSTIRDHLILLLRKALYSSKTETRQMAVVGYIKLLTTLKIVDAASLSQLSGSMSSFSSGHSLFTQLSLNRSSQCSQNSFSNEALSLEILSILKRCLMQKLQVRNQLYEGLVEAVNHNPEIKIPVLDVLWLHFSNYYVTEEDSLPPLNFSRISITKDIDVIQQESFGKLLHVIGLILSLQEENDDSVSTIQKFKKVMESCCDRMMICELIHFDLDDGTDLSDIVPESKQKVYVLQEALRVYEALIAYKLNSWNNSSERNGTQIVSLFQGYNRLVHFSKNIGKSKKERKKKNDSSSSILSNNTTLKKEQKNNFVFKMPDTILDFRTVIRALKLLQMPVVEWTTMQDANIVKSKREVHRHFFQSLNYMLTHMKSKKHRDSQAVKDDFKNIVDVAEVIYSRCIKTLNIFIDFDCSSAVLAAECFHAILNCISSSHKTNLLLFLRKICEKENESLVPCLSEVIKVYQNLFEMDEDLESEDPEVKKLPLIFINTLTLLSTFIPSESTSLSIEFYDWIKILQKINQYKKGIKLLDEVICSMGANLDTTRDVQPEAEKFTMINELTLQNAYICITNTIKALLDEIDWVISRLKSEYVIVSFVDDANNFRSEKENLLAKEKGISCQLCFIVTVLENLMTISIQPGNLADALFKNISQFYITLTNFTKYFNSRSTRTNPAFQSSRFEKLVKYIGRGLSPNVNALILFLEEESKKEQATQTKKKTEKTISMKTKILKDTRSIPKIVYGMEQFSNSIMQLSNKTKIDLSKHIGQGTTRDFRIMVSELDTQQENVSRDISREENSDDSESINEDEEDERNQNRDPESEEAEEEQQSPPMKKSRKS